MTSAADKKADQVTGNSAQTSFIGHIEPFLLEDDFEQYIERLEHLFILNNIEDSNKKVSLFISFAGGDLYKILKSLIAPKLVKEYTFETLTKTLITYFNPKRNIRAERHKFMSRSLRNDESLSDFMVELKILAESCDFGQYLDQALCDKFIWSQKDEVIQRSLLNLPMEKSFSEVCETALTMERTSKEVKAIQGTNNGGGSGVGGTAKDNLVGKITERSDYNGNRRGRSVSRNRNSRNRSSYRNKSKQATRFKDIQCYRCQKWGHYASYCDERDSKNKRGKSSTFKRNNNLNNVDISNSISDNLSHLTLGNVHFNNGKHISDSLLIKLKINGLIVDMEIDSGACFSIISHFTFNKYFKNSTELKSFSKNLNVVTGESVSVLGFFNACVLYGNSEYYLDLFVIRSKTEFVPLCGRNWLNVIFSNWRDYFSLKSVCMTSVENELIEQFPTVFDNNFDSVIKNHVAEIIVEEKATPIFHKAYTVPYGLRDKVNSELDRLIEKKILVPVKFSEWASPIVPVEKKDGSIRICIDCKATVNKYVKTDHYSFPRMDEILSSFYDCECFCILDLAGAFQQLALSKNSQKFMTVITDRGLLRYTRLPYGVKSAPATFQATADSILHGLKNVKCYIDDIIIGGNSKENCRAKLFMVLERFQTYNVKVKLEKCKFFQSSVEYLGHKINSQGISPKQEKMDAILNAPAPKDLTSLRAYIGLLNFYNKFIPNLSARLSPLYNLLRKETSFEWDDKCEKTFQESKQWLLGSSLLTHYNPDKELGLVCDASSYGVGAVLFHIEDDGEERPIMFISSSLTKAEKGYAQIEREALAVIFAVKRFHKYLYGRQFKIFSDHKPLEVIFGTKSTNAITAARLQRWALTLSQYDYKISYRKGSKMGNADALSRLPLQEQTNISSNLINFFNIAGELPIKREDVARETLKDKYLSKIIEYIKEGWPSSFNDNIFQKFYNKRVSLCYSDGCLLMGSRIVVPGCFKEKILTCLHEGHIGIVRMKSIARGSVWWLNIDRDIESLVRSCLVCQQLEKKSGPIGLSSWPQTSFPFERLHIDFFYFQRKTFFIMFDTFSKWMEVILMTRTNASDVISAFRRCFSTFGLPKEIVSDNGPPFGSKEVLEFCLANDIRLTKTPPYHPESNGSAERAVQTVKTALKKYLLDSKTNSWPIQTLLDNFLFRYRNSPTTCDNLTPSSKVLSFAPRTKLDFLKNSQSKSLDIAPKKNITKTSERVTIPSKTDVLFKKNDWVWYRVTNNNTVRWKSGTIHKQISKSVYIVKIDNYGFRKVHGQQLRKRVSKVVHFDTTKKLNDENEIIKTEQIEPPESEDLLEGRKRKRDSSNSGDEFIPILPQREKSRRVSKPPLRYQDNWYKKKYNFGKYTE